MEDVEELDLKEIINAFWSKKWIIVLLVILGMIVGFIYTKYLVEPNYSSSVTFILSKPVGVSQGQYQINNLEDASITQADITLNQKLISTYREIVTSKKIVNQVIENLNIDYTYKNLLKCISVTAISDTDVIKISVKTPDAKVSADVANELVDVFSGEVADIYNIQNVSIIDKGQVDNTPVNVSYTKNAVVFALIFFVIGAGIIFVIYYFDNTIKSKEEIEKLINVPVLAMIPDMNSIKEENKKWKK